MKRSIPSLAVATTVVLLLTACAGSDAGGTSTDEPSTGESITTTQSTTTTSTTAPESTTTTLSTSSTTTTTTTETTVPPSSTTTTTEPPPPTADAVTDGLVASREAYLYAVYNLDAPDAIDRLNSTHAAGSPSLELAMENVQTLVDNGWLARPNPDVPDTITIESEVTIIDDTTAEVTACVVGAGVVYAPGADNGDDVIVNGEIEAALNRVTMVLEDGQWKLSEGTNLTTESGTECVAE